MLIFLLLCIIIVSDPDTMETWVYIDSAPRSRWTQDLSHELTSGDSALSGWNYIYL